MFRKLFTCVIIHVHVCVSKGQTILSLQWTQLWEDKKQKFWIYNIHVICCVKKKFHFLERWSKHVLCWPHDTCMCFQAVCLEIICSDPREYCKFFLFGNSLEISQNILFSLPSNLIHLYFPSMPPGNLHVFFWSKQVFQMLCYFLYHLIIAVLQRKSTVGLVLVSVSTYFGSCFNSPKKNI